MSSGADSAIFAGRVWEPHERYVPLRRSGTVHGRSGHGVDVRPPSADTVAGRQSSKTASTAVHHRVAERPAGRVVEEEVGGEVGVEEVLEDVLGHQDRVAGLVVGVQLRHDEQVDTDRVTRRVADQEHDRHHQQDFRHLNTEETNSGTSFSQRRHPVRK